VAPVDPLQVQADQALAHATAAAHAGDFKRLRTKAQEAVDLAQTPRQQDQAQSLVFLADGFDAMLEGDFKRTGLAWSQITDPRLHSEVMHHADRLGIDVPAAYAQTSSTKALP